MASYNHVVLVGNITRDIEMKYTQSGTAICPFSIAVNDRVKRGDEWVDEATFVECTAFGKTAEVIGEYCSKGSPILVEGRLKLETWEKEGEKRSKLCVIANRIQLLGGRKEGEASRNGSHKATTRVSEPVEEEIPF